MKIGNAHSNLLKSLPNTDNTKTKVESFSDSILKIASEKPNSLKETLASIAEQSKKNGKFVKQAQMEHMPPPSPEPAPLPPIESDTTNTQPGEDNGVADAKKGLIDALIALCGGKEQAIQCIQDCCQDENAPELTDEAMGTPPAMEGSPANNDAPTM